jgi:hypothetical protein
MQFWVTNDIATRGSSPGVKRPGHEVNHCPPPGAEVKNALSYTSTVQYVFMAWHFVKPKNNFITTYSYMRFWT